MGQLLLVAVGEREPAPEKRQVRWCKGNRSSSDDELKSAMGVGGGGGESRGQGGNEDEGV